MRVIVTGAQLHRFRPGAARCARKGYEVAQRRRADLRRQSRIASAGRGEGEPSVPSRRISATAAAMERRPSTFRPDRRHHLARAVSIVRSRARRDFIETNVIGTFTLLEAARGYWSSLGGAEDRLFVSCMCRP